MRLGYLPTRCDCVVSAIFRYLLPETYTKRHLVSFIKNTVEYVMLVFEKRSGADI